MNTTRDPHQKATMTGTQFKHLRLAMGLAVRDLARLLACSETTIRMIEAPGVQQRPSRLMAQVMQWLSDPVIRKRVEKIQK